VGRGLWPNESLRSAGNDCDAEEVYAVAKVLRVLPALRVVQGR
jgi:hypothetical protein